MATWNGATDWQDTLRAEKGPPLITGNAQNVPTQAGRTIIYDAARDGLTNVTTISGVASLTLSTFDGEPALRIEGTAGATAVVQFLYTAAPFAFDRGLVWELASDRSTSTGFTFQAGPDATFTAYVEQATNPSAPSTTSPWGYRTIQPYMTSSFAGVTPADPNFTPGYQGTWSATPPTFPTELGVVRFRLSPSGSLAPLGFIKRFSALRPRKSRIVLTFDDATMSAYRFLKPIMDKYNFKGSFSLISNLIGSTSVYMSLRELQNLYDQGHELVAHGPAQGVGNIVTNYTSVPQAIGDAEYHRDQIKAWGLLKPGAEKAYVWPQGQFATALNDSRYLDGIRAAGFTVGRCASIVVANCIADLWPEPLTLPIIGHTQAASSGLESTNITDIIARVNGCASRGTDGILMFHYGVPSTDTNWGSNGGLNIRTTDFDAICSAIATNVAAGTQEVVLLSKLSKT